MGLNVEILLLTKRIREDDCQMKCFNMKGPLAPWIMAPAAHLSTTLNSDTCHCWLQTCRAFTADAMLKAVWAALAACLAVEGTVCDVSQKRESPML